MRQKNSGLSEKIYSFLLTFYPKNFQQDYGEEMQYIFTKSLQRAQAQSEKSAIIGLWIKILIDFLKTIPIQHLKNLNEEKFMKDKVNNFLANNKIFTWLAVMTALILLIPLAGMQLSGQIVWTLLDFTIAAFLIFGALSLFVFVAKKVDKSYRIALAVAFALAFSYIWAELAVGIFANFGS